MSGPSVYLSWPTAFTLRPDPIPPTLPPPVKERTFRSPFGIDKDLYNYALQPEIPIIFAACYITTVFALNAYNRSRGNKKWWIARQKPFQWFVVLHNVSLALYSLATWIAMYRAARHTWPGFNNPNGLAGIADAACKIHGPRGLGDAATYNTTINIWEAKNQLIKLGYDGNPDPTDVGRLWNEGLAFWGWLFYMSKFYEVIDTLIIVAKGKRSATLQTYHHAGAMLCMWAGIRYMSPPIWMFVFINSGIHTMMYTYYTLSALGIRVPQGVKRTLTSLQIAQLLFGTGYAALHLFVQYDIPVTTSYQVMTTIQRVVSSASSAVASVATDASKVIASPTATATLGALFKKLLLRAAGEEGVAERVHDKRTGELTTPHMEEKIQHFNEQTFETKWRTDYTKVNCIDTTGEAFAIYLNIIYFAPLTFLFARFFYKAYTQRGKPKKASQAPKQITDSAREAERRTEEAIEKSGKRIEEELSHLAPDAASRVRKEATDLRNQLREDVQQMKDKKLRGDRRVSDRVASFERQVKTSAQKAAEKGKELVNGSESGSRSGSPSKASPSKRESEIPESNEESAADNETEREGRSPLKEEPQSKSNKEKDEQQSKPSKEKVSNAQGDTPSESKESELPKAQKDQPKQPQKDEPSTPQKDEPSTSQKDESSTPSKKEAQQSKDQPPQSPSPKKQPPKLQRGNSQKSHVTQPPRPQSPTKIPQKSKNGTPSKTTGDKQPQSHLPKKQPSTAQLGSGTNNQSEKKQDENLADSQTLRPSTPVKKGANKENRPQSSNSLGAGLLGGGLLGAGANNLSEAKQDANMADSQTIRPGDTVEDSPGRDTDAMGQSGSIIDFTKETAKDLQKVAEDAREGAEHAGTEWARPGSSDS